MGLRPGGWSGSGKDNPVPPPLRRGRSHRGRDADDAGEQAEPRLRPGRPAELWRKAGAEHPFGEDLRGYADLVPERYDRKTVEEAIAAVPPALVDEGPLL